MSQGFRIGLPAVLMQRATVAWCILFSGCVLAPRAAEEQRVAVARAGAAYRGVFEERNLPVLPAAPTRRDVVQRALAANGDVEAAYFDWAAAVHRIDRAGAYPNTAFSLDVSRALSGRGSAFDRTSLTLGFDPMENLAFPTKVYQAAKVATADAAAAEQRLVAVRFDLQRRVLAAWTDYAAGAERLRIAHEVLGVAELDQRTAAARVASGAPTTEILRAETTRQRTADEVATLTATLTGDRARVNALLARAPQAKLTAPASLEAPRIIPSDDAWLVSVAAEHDPTLAALVHEVTGRRNALALARQQYIPDFNPFVSTEGAAAQLAGMVISIPTLLREVGAQIRESRAALSAAIARRRQVGADRAAALVAALLMVRDNARRLALIDGPLRQLATDMEALATRQYGTDAGDLGGMLAARRATLNLRGLRAEAWAAHENAVAELETLIGVDVEALVAANAIRTTLGRAEAAR